MSGLRYALVVFVTAVTAGLLALFGVAFGTEPAARWLVHTAHGHVSGRVLPIATVHMLAYSCAVVAFLGCVSLGLESTGRRYR